MARPPGRRAIRRKNLLRNLDRLRRDPVTSPPPGGSAPGPHDWPEIALGALRGALRITGLTRGLVSLRVPGEGSRFRTLHRLGFEDGADYGSVLLQIMARTLQRGHHAQIDGALLGAARAQLGVIVAVPLCADGAILGAVVLDDPDRSNPLSRTTLARLHEFADQSATVLSLRLVQTARARLRATA